MKRPRALLRQKIKTMKQIALIFFLTVVAQFAAAQNQSTMTTMTVNQEAHVVQSKEIFINAAPERVWEVLTEIENWNEWNERIKNPSSIDDLKIGSRFSWKSKGSKIKAQIHTLQTNQAIGWSGNTFGASAIHNWSLVKSEHGTLVKVEESMEGWLINLMKNKMNKILADDMEFWLEQLRMESEKDQH